MSNQLKAIINSLFERISDLDADSFTSEEAEAVDQAIAGLDSGELRICDKSDNKWRVNDWLKQAILLYFRRQKMQTFEAGDLNFYDKVPLKKWNGSEGVRAVPHALVRKGAFVAPGVVLMPSYVNIGAFVDSGSMVDTWATVGSCAQIGKNVHLSGGVGIGGVLEPVQASPVIIEDNAFIGSRCIVVEGVVVETGAVLAAGVTITASTKIIDVSENQEKVFQGRVPANSIVIPGMRTKTYPAGEYSSPCALIIGKRSESTDKKTSLTQALRDYELSV